VKKSIAAASVAGIGVMTAVVLGIAGNSAAAQSSAGPGARQAPVAPVASVVAAKQAWARPAAPVRAEDRSLTFKHAGRSVTVSKRGRVVATVTVVATTYGSRSARATLQVKAVQRFSLNTDRFMVNDLDGGENSVHAPRTRTLNRGTSTFVLQFTNTHAKPWALGWVPNDDAVFVLDSVAENVKAF
jgi:antitoxin (DNA-binding transcriptional repressor) of toxin-antitoxin stability system